MDQDFQNHVSEALGRIEASQSGMKEALLHRITELEEDRDEMKPLVDRHDRIVVFAGWLAVPTLAAAHVLLKGILSQVGWK